MDIHPKDTDKLQKHILSLYEKGEIISPSPAQERELILTFVISPILTIITAWFYFDSPSGFFDFIFYIFKALGLMIGYYIGTIVLFALAGTPQKDKPEKYINHNLAEIETHHKESIEVLESKLQTDLQNLDIKLKNNLTNQNHIKELPVKSQQTLQLSLSQGFNKLHDLKAKSEIKLYQTQLLRFQNRFKYFSDIEGLTEEDFENKLSELKKDIIEIDKMKAGLARVKKEKLPN